MGGKKSSPATQTTNPSTVWNPQAGYLADMYQQAQNMFQSQNANRSWEGDFANMASQYGQANTALDQSMGQYQSAGQGLQQGYGVLGQAAQGFGGLMNPGQNPMSDVYARLTGQQFNEQIMPGLRGDAMVGGGLGGSRSGIAQGLAASRASQQLQDWNARLYNEDMNRVLQASQGLSGLGGQYGQLAGQQAGIGAGMADIGSRRAQLGDMYGNLGITREQMPWQALQRYASLIGAPTVMSGGGTATGATQGSSGAIGAIAPIAGAVLAPFTGGASLLAASAVSAGANAYYK